MAEKRRRKSDAVGEKKGGNGRFCGVEGRRIAHGETGKCDRAHLGAYFGTGMVFRSRLFAVYVRTVNRSAAVRACVLPLLRVSASPSASSWNAARSHTTDVCFCFFLNMFWSNAVQPGPVDEWSDFRSLKRCACVCARALCEIAPPLELSIYCLVVAGTILGEPGLQKDVKRCSQMHPILNAYVIVCLPSPFWLSNPEK